VKSSGNDACTPEKSGQVVLWWMAGKGLLAGGSIGSIGIKKPQVVPVFRECGVMSKPKPSNKKRLSILVTGKP